MYKIIEIMKCVEYLWDSSPTMAEIQREGFRERISNLLKRPNNESTSSSGKFFFTSPTRSQYLMEFLCALTWNSFFNFFLFFF